MVLKHAISGTHRLVVLIGEEKKPKTKDLMSGRNDCQRQARTERESYGNPEWRKRYLPQDQVWSSEDSEEEFGVAMSEPKESA